MLGETSMSLAAEKRRMRGFCSVRRQTKAYRKTKPHSDLHQRTHNPWRKKFPSSLRFSCNKHTHQMSRRDARRRDSDE